jgi:hypothetical protein
LYESASAGGVDGESHRPGALGEPAAQEEGVCSGGGAREDLEEPTDECGVALQNPELTGPGGEGAFLRADGEVILRHIG